MYLLNIRQLTGSDIFIGPIPNVPDGKTPEVIVGPDPVGRDKGGDDDAVDGDNGGLIHGDGKDIGQMDHEASTKRGKKCGD
jgi:hypothetical protein